MKIKRKKDHKHGEISILLFIFVVIFIWGYFLVQVHPEKIVNSLGIENSYVVMFFVSLLGGLSSFSSLLIYTTLATFVFGGANFLLIGIIATIGAFLSDIFFYSLALKSHTIIPEHGRKKIEKIYEKIEIKYKWAIPFFIILYVGFTPFPNDLLLIPMGISHYPMKKAVLPIFISLSIHFIGLAYLFSNGYILFF